MNFYKNRKIILGINHLMRNLGKHQKYSFEIKRSITRDRIISFFNTLKPENYGFELIRLGNDYDGGYLIPDDLVGVKKCISPGVGNSINFEKNLASKHGIESYLADPTVNISETLPSEIKFQQIAISYSSEINEITDMATGERREYKCVTLEEFTNANTVLGEVDLLLQMDIENAEYLTLLVSDPKILEKFRIMIIEFHSIPNIFEEKYFMEVIKPLFNKINSIFYVAHIHANNVAKPVKILNFEIPHAIEVTFHNRNRIKDLEGTNVKEVYNILDKPCDSLKAEVYLDRKLFQNPHMKVAR
jgi:hypothetical protein